MIGSGRDEEQLLPSNFSLPKSTSGSTLAQHYIPDKITQSPSYWGAEARTASRKAAGGWGAAAGPRRDSHGITLANSTSIRGNGVLFRPAYQEYIESSGSSSSIYSASNPLGHKDPFSSSANSILGPPSSGHRNRKWGRGREAWGKDGAGDPALGAGDFEDDDGLDLSQNHSNGVHNFGTETFSSSRQTTSNSPAEMSLLPSIIAVSTKTKESRVRWNRFKWTLVAANILLTLYSLVGFVAVILFWTGMYKDSKVLDIVNRTEMALGLVAMTLCVIISVIGWAGILLNNRSFLSLYTLLLWIAFIFIVAPGYIAYKKRTFNLSGKVNQLWSTQLTLQNRQIIQRSLKCCGYYSPFIEAAADSFRCFSRSSLPGCKGPLINFEKQALQYVYIVSFSIVPCHLGVIVISLLCSDHITYRFGKGVTPKEYRVDDSIIQSAILRQSMNFRSPEMDNEKDKLLPSPRPPFWGTNSNSGAATPSSSTSSVSSSQEVKPI